MLLISRRQRAFAVFRTCESGQGNSRYAARLTGERAHLLYEVVAILVGHPDVTDNDAGWTIVAD